MSPNATPTSPVEITRSSLGYDSKQSLQEISIGLHDWDSYLLNIGSLFMDSYIQYSGDMFDGVSLLF